MTAAVLDVRHAGGAVLVASGEFLDHAVVRLGFPGFEVPLYPAEAVHLAVELIAAAHRAENPAVDDWPKPDGDG